MVEPLSAILLSGGKALYRYATGTGNKPVTIGNRTSKNLYVALCFTPERTRETWLTVGWLRVDAYTTEVYPVPVMRIGSPVYLYARTKGGARQWTGDATKIAVAVPVTGKVRAGDKFVTSEPKGSIPLLQSSSCNARVRMVGAQEIKVGVDGGALNLVQRQS
ncbi:DUF1036 domain-containing protein [Streptomyces chartreusis]|uniref:DUF1036 domain-containing protein n=1 Tax=Streptomyces chartreusis TaxID=1969 RepID=UPI00123E23C6|nr:DUF1036 domain-containing protein [Streptomyces chartreusis]QEV72089.1 DUF1036 domain-containing protein [Streptomyces chartreusis]GGX20886.1 hypothetical protein GCM10010321_39080 [Streptomyces chartreusis]